MDRWQTTAIKCASRHFSGRSTGFATSLAVLLAVTPLLGGCPSKPTYPKPDALPSAEQFVQTLTSRQNEARSFQAESRMDYRVGDDRIKTTVLVMGERSAKVRFNALNPDDTTAADLACDGLNFAFVDFNKNCQLAGPCTSEAIAALLRVELEPDDFLTLAIGSAPLIGDADSTLEWNSSSGSAVLSRISKDKQLSQEIVMDGRSANYDVTSATVRDAEGKVQWTLENKDFGKTTGKDGKEFRVPAKTRFQQPKVKGDLKIRWNERTLNLELAPEKFVMELPGTAECGRKPTVQSSAL